jgi:O-antigen ligase
MSLSRFDATAGLIPWFWASLWVCGAGILALALVTEDAKIPMLVLAAIPTLLAMLVWPDVATILVVGAIFTNAPVVAVKYHRLPYVLGACVPLLLAVPIARDVLFARRKLLITPALLPFLGFFVIQVLGVLLAVRPEAAAMELGETAIEGFVLYLLLTNAIRTPDVLRRVVWVLILSGALMGALAGHQQFTGNFESNYGGFSRASNTAFDTGEEELQPRLAGPIGEQNRFAQILALVIPLALFRIWSKRSGSGARALAFGCLLLIGTGFALAFSRGAAVGLAAMFLVMMTMGYVRVRHAALILVLVGLVGLAVPQYAARLARLADVAALLAEDDSGPGLKGADGATRGRVSEMTAAVMMFGDHPLLGVGPNMYREHYRDYAETVGLRVKDQKRAAHSLYLGMAAEHGLLGLLAFGLIIYVTFRDLARARRFWQPVDRDLADMQAALMMMLIVNLTTAAFLHLAYFRYFSLVLAVAGAASHLRSVRLAPERRGRGFQTQRLEGSLVGRASR